MTTSHEETLFDIASPGDVAPSNLQDVAIKRGNTGIKHREADKNLEDRLDAEADKLGSFVLARARLGLPIEAEKDDEDLHARTMPGKALSYPKPGYVRDFHDGGRSD